MSNLTWLYADSPWDLFHDCEASKTDESKRTFCTMSTALGVISMYIFPVFSTFGLITNIHIIIVFLCCIRKKSRQMIHLSFLALADCLNIIAIGWFWMVPAKGIPYATGGRVYFFTYNVSPPVCIAHRYINSVTSCMSTTAFLLICLDRCLAIHYPFKARSFGVKSAWLAVVGVILFSVLIPLPFLFIMGHITSEAGIIGCSLLFPSVFWQFYHLFFCNVGLFQSVLILLINIALIVKLKLVLKQRGTLTEGATQTGSNSSLSARETSATILILLLSVLFLLCSFPQVVAFLMAFLIQQFSNDSSSSRFYWNLGDNALHLYFLQESVNWLFYVWRMPEFRARAVPCCPQMTDTPSESNVMQEMREPRGRISEKK